jgi:hypothetical protein
MNERFRAVLALCLLVAFAWQGVLTQTHLHIRPAGDVAASVRSVSDTAVPKHRSRSDSPASCPICIEVALSGHYLGTSVAELATPALALVWYDAPRLRASSRQTQSHDWRSRAPPRQLQA